MGWMGSFLAVEMGMNSSSWIVRGTILVRHPSTTCLKLSKKPLAGMRRVDRRGPKCVVPFGWT